MAGKTTNYGLLTIEGTDEIALVENFNALSNGVDTALKGVEDKTTPGTITTTTGDFVTGVTPTTAAVVNKVTTAAATVLASVTGTPTAKTITTYADLDAHPSLLSGYAVTTTTASVLKSATPATVNVVSGVTAATGKAVTGVTLSTAESK